MTASAAGGTGAPSAEAIFLDYASHSREDVRGVFERYDADGDGSLSGVEMRNMLRDVGLVSAFDTAEDCAFLKKQLIAADRDGDGAVGFEEFTVYLNTVAAPRARSTKPRGNTAGGTKISFFAENDLFVADPRVSAHSRVTETEIAAASPGTPELTAERGRRDVSRHGTRSRIPTPPPSYSKSSSKTKTSPRASPGSATRFGFANSPSSTPSSSASSGESQTSTFASRPSRLASRLSMTPGTPRASFSTRETSTPTSSKTVRKSLDASASLPETPSPLPAFAGPSRVHDATNDLLAFVRNLELENERRERREAADARGEGPKDEGRKKKDGSVERSRAAPRARVLSARTVVPEATPKPSIARLEPVSVKSPSCLECLQSVRLQTTESIESALETFEAAAARASAANGARPDGDSDDSDADSAAKRVRVFCVSPCIATGSTGSVPSKKVQKIRAARYVLCLALLLLAAAAFFSHHARADGSVILETCPAPSPITAARARERFISETKTSGPFRLEPNVILPRDSFPATEAWTF